MHHSIEPEDLEPLDADERLDKVYGLYHIGRDDETRDELALFFDPALTPEPDFLTRRLWMIVNAHGGRLCAFSEFSSAARSHRQLEKLADASIRYARTFDGNFDSLCVVIVELAKPASTFLDSALRAYTAYVGYGDISWPSDFRSVITANQEYL